MKLLPAILILFVLTGGDVFCQTVQNTGLASYYGKQFHGRRTANGERYDMHSKTSAHRTLPFNSLVKVTNLKNGKSTIVRINDRGPMKKSRIIDLSYFAAKEIDLVHAGVAKVKIELIEMGEDERLSSSLKECCFSEIENFAPVLSYNIYGQRTITEGGINEGRASRFVFSEEYVNDSISRIVIRPVDSLTLAADKSITNNKGRKKNRNAY